MHVKQKFDVHLEYVELYDEKYVYDILLVDQDGSMNIPFANSKNDDGVNDSDDDRMPSPNV